MLWKCVVRSSLAVILAAAFAGCGGDANPAKVPPKDSAAKASTAAKDTAAAADDVSGLKELDEADRKLAETQRVCPKTGELLGSMGKPYKITLKDRVVFLCCQGCEEAVKKDPDTYLKKLDALTAKK